MKCRRCREPAVIDVRRHNAGFCRDCFLHHCREQVRRAIDDFDMIAARRAGARRGVGRQGLARAVAPPARARLRRRRPLPRARHRRVLRPSGRVRARVRAERTAGTLLEIDLRDDYGFDVPDGARAAQARAVLGVRAVEAPPLQRRRDRRTATTCSRPATTSTTKPRCCSATCCAGRPSTSAASIRCCPRRPASRAR